MDQSFDHQMSLSKSKCLYSNNCLHFLKTSCSIVSNQGTKSHVYLGTLDGKITDGIFQFVIAPSQKNAAVTHQLDTSST